MLTLSEPTNSSSAMMTPDPSQQQNNNNKKQQKQPLTSSLLDDVSDDGSSADDSPYAELGAIAKSNRISGTISNNDNNDNDIAKKSNTSSFSSSFIWIKNQIDGNRVKFVPQSGKISNLTREKIEDFIASSGNPSFSVRDGFILTFNGNFFPKNTTLGTFVSKRNEYDEDKNNADDLPPGSITLLLQPIHTLPEDEQKKIFLSQMQELKNCDSKAKNPQQEKDLKKLSCSDVAAAAVNSNSRNTNSESEDTKNIEEKELHLKQEENSLNHRTPQRLLRKGPSASLRIEQDTEEAAIIEKQLLHTSEQSLRRSLKNESKEDDGDNKQNISTHQKKKGTNSINVNNAGSDCAIVGDCDVFNEELDEELTSSKSSPHHGGKQTSRSNNNKDNAKSPSSTSISREESSPTTTTTITITKPSQNARKRANTATSMTSDSAASIRSSSSSQPKQTIANNKIKNNQQESSSMTKNDTLPSTSSSWLIIKNTTNGQNYRFVSPASNVSELSAHRIKEFLLVAVGLNPHYHVLTFQGTKLLPENRKRNLGSFGVFIGSTILVEKSDEYLEFENDDGDANDQGDENDVLVGEMGTQTGDDGSLRNVELFRKRQEERNRRRRADAIAKEFADQRDRIENQETFERMKLAEDQSFERHWFMVVGLRKEFEELMQVTSSNDGRGTQRDLKMLKNNNKRTKTATASSKNPTFYYQHGGGLDIRPLLLVQDKKSGNRENQSEEKSFLGGVGVAKNSSNSRPSTSTAGKDNNKNKNHLESKYVHYHKYDDDDVILEEDEEDDSSSPIMLQLKTFKSSLSDVQSHAHLAALWNLEKIKQQQENKNKFQGSRSNNKPASRPTSSVKNINNENDEQQNQQPLTASSIRKNRSMNFNGNNTLSSASQSPEKSSNNEGKLLMTSKSFSLFLTNQQKKSKKTKKKENNNNNIINIMKNTASLRDGYEVIQVNDTEGGHDEFGNSGNSNSNMAKQNSTGLNFNNSGNTNNKKKTVGFDTSSRKKQQKISADKNNQDGNNNNNNNNTSYYDNYDDHDDEEPSLYNDDAERNNHNNHLHNRNSNNEFESSDEDDDEDEEGQRDEDDVQTNKHDDNHRHDYENDKTTSKFAATTPSSRGNEQEQKHRGAVMPPSPAPVSFQKIVSAPPISSRYLSKPLAALLNVSSSSRTQTPSTHQNHNKNNGNMNRDGDEDNREEKHAADNKKLLTWYQPMRYPRPPPPRVGGWLKVDKFDGTFKRMKNPNSVFAEVMEKRRLGIELPPTK